MSKKNLIEQEKKSSSQKESDFLVQSNIDDFLTEPQKKEEIIVENSQTEKQENLEIQTSLEIAEETKEESSKVLEEELEIKPENIEVSSEEVEQNISLQKKKIDEVEQSVSKQNTKKSKILNLVFFVVNLCVVAGILTFQLLKEDFTPIGNLRMQPLSLLAVIVLLSLVILTETFVISYLVKQTTGKWRFGTSYKVSQIGRYYDSVTPMATGGQPFQVSYLKSRGVPVHTALSIPLSKYVFGQIAWVVVSFACLVVSWVDKSYGTFVSVASIIGFVLAFIVLAATIFLSVSKKVGKILVVKILKLLYKMKIVKNYDKQYEKITKYISDYQDVMKQYAKSPKDFTIMTLASILKNVLIYSMPFFIVKFLVPGTAWTQYFRLFVMSCLVDLSSSFFPLPGGTGMNEISFTAAFGSLGMPTDVLVWVLLMWRFCTYYFYLVQGICIISYDVAYGNRKYKWQVRKNYLVEESAVFKQEQINRFRTARAKRRKNKNKNGTREYL